MVVKITMGYKYEMHCHTKASSKCSILHAEDIVNLYTSLKYTGIFVTDHFLNGNTTADYNSSWKNKVDILCRGYQEVKEIGEKFGLQVFFGWEYCYKGTDFLIYGLNKDWIMKNEHIMNMDCRKFLNYAAYQGALVCQAHPFREDHHIDHIRLYPSDVECIETYNSSRNDRCNNLANTLAESYGLHKIGGSDIHNLNQEIISGMEFSEKAESDKDIIDFIRNGKGNILKISNPFLNK